MTSGKAGGLLGEPLKGADKTVSRLKAAESRSFPLAGGRLGWGYKRLTTHIFNFYPLPNPPPGAWLCRFSGFTTTAYPLRVQAGGNNPMELHRYFW